MEELPPEIITNILSRLHFKSMGKCRCVSKHWHSILSDTTFPTIHLTQLSKLTPDLLLRFKSLESGYLRSRIYYLEDNEALNKRPLRPFKLLDESFLNQSFPDDPRIVGSCNGFICFFSTTRACFGWETPINVFNPITEQLFQLPPFQLRRNHKWLSGFGFEDSSKEFKFVFIKDKEVKVNTLGSSTWRSNFGIVPDELFLCDEIVSPAFVNGSLHWITMDNRSLIHGPLIVSFNLGIEEFGFVQTPLVFNYSYTHYRLGLIAEYLSVVEYAYRSSEACINVWVMNKYNVTESWVKQFSISQEVLPCSKVPKLIKFRENGELLLLCSDKYLIGFDTVRHKARRLSLGWARKKQGCLLEVHAVVGSIVSVKAAFGVDRIRKKITLIKRKRQS